MNTWDLSFGDGFSLVLKNFQTSPVYYLAYNIEKTST